MYNMIKQYSVKYTRENFASLLKSLPFEVTRYGTVVAKVVGKSTTNDVHDTSSVKTQNNVVQDSSPEEDWSKAEPLNCSFPKCDWVGPVTHFEGPIYDYQQGEIFTKGDYCPIHLIRMEEKRAKD